MDAPQSHRPPFHSKRADRTHTHTHKHTRTHPHAHTHTHTSGNASKGQNGTVGVCRHLDQTDVQKTFPPHSLACHVRQMCARVCLRVWGGGRGAGVRVCERARAFCGTASLTLNVSKVLRRYLSQIRKGLDALADTGTSVYLSLSLCCVLVYLSLSLRLRLSICLSLFLCFRLCLCLCLCLCRCLCPSFCLRRQGARSNMPAWPKK